MSNNQYESDLVKACVWYCLRAAQTATAPMLRRALFGNFLKANNIRKYSNYFDDKLPMMIDHLAESTDVSGLNKAKWAFLVGLKFDDVSTSLQKLKTEIDSFGRAHLNDNSQIVKFEDKNGKMIFEETHLKLKKKIQKEKKAAIYRPSPVDENMEEEELIEPTPRPFMSMWDSQRCLVGEAEDEEESQLLEFLKFLKNVSVLVDVPELQTLVDRKIEDVSSGISKITPEGILQKFEDVICCISTDWTQEDNWLTLKDVIGEMARSVKRMKGSELQKNMLYTIQEQLEYTEDERVSKKVLLRELAGLARHF